MSENKKLTPEEVAEKLIKHAKENEKPVRALQDDELDSVAGGGGNYVISDSNGERVSAHCYHPETTNGDLQSALLNETACSYGQTAGAVTCYNCPYFMSSIGITITVDVFPTP